MPCDRDIATALGLPHIPDTEEENQKQTWHYFSCSVIPIRSNSWLKSYEEKQREEMKLGHLRPRSEKQKRWKTWNEEVLMKYNQTSCTSQKIAYLTVFIHTILWFFFKTFDTKDFVFVSLQPDLMFRSDHKIFFFFCSHMPHNYTLKFPYLSAFPISFPLMKSWNKTAGVKVLQICDHPHWSI